MMSTNNKDNETRKTNLVPAVCTQCGGALEVDPTQDAAVCPFCGTPFIVEKAITQYNITHVNVNQNIRIQHGKRGVFESAMEVLDNQLEREHNASIRSQELQLEKEKLEMLKQEQRRQRTQEFMTKAGNTLKDERTHNIFKLIIKYIVLFYAWVLIFPIPLSNIIKNNNNLSEQQKKTYIIASWAAYAVMLIIGFLTYDPNKATSAIKLTTILFM